MARRNTTRAQDQSAPATISDTELLPALREYHTSDLRPSTRPAYAQTMLSAVHDPAEIEDPQAPAGRVLQ